MTENNDQEFEAQCRRTRQMIETWAENTTGGLHWFDVSYQFSPAFAKFPRILKKKKKKNR